MLFVNKAIYNFSFTTIVFLVFSLILIFGKTESISSHWLNLSLMGLPPIWLSLPERKECNHWCVWDDGRWISLREFLFHVRYCRILCFHFVIMIVIESFAAAVVVEVGWFEQEPIRRFQ